jgi:glycosyltransferase involved in cell wall biosynthesis
VGDRVQTTVIIPANGAWTTLPRVLDALEAQLGSRREVILVDSSPDARSRVQAATVRWPWLQIIVPMEPATPGRARNMGATKGQGDGLVFLDADAVPEPDWLDHLEAALRPELDAIAGAVLNGTPKSLVGTAGYLLEFSEWLPGRRSQVRHGAACNLLFRRDVYVASGGMPEDIWPCEDTAATLPLAQAGRLGFAPLAQVRHLNRVEPHDFRRHQRRLGAAYRELCSRGVAPHRALAHRAARPIVFALRLAALSTRLALHPREAGQALQALPWILVGLSSWCAGFTQVEGAEGLDGKASDAN